MDLLRYRRLAKIDEEGSKKKFYFTHKLCTSGWLRIFMVGAGGFIWFLTFISGKKVTPEPEAWSKFGNMLYFGLTRLLFAFGGFLMLFPVLYSPNTFVKEFMKRPVFRMVGSLCFMAAMITPLCIMQYLTT